MGEAKRRKKEIERIKAANESIYESICRLEEQERVVAEVAIATFEKIVMGYDMVEGCYELAFFISEYLLREKQIKTNRIFGWVTNPKTLPYGMAHAWIEFNGQITDVSVFNNENPDIYVPGSVLVQGVTYREGLVRYDYHVELLRENILKRIEFAETSPGHAMALKKKEDEHIWLKEMSNRPDGANEYFSKVLADDSYEFYKAIIEPVSNGRRP